MEDQQEMTALEKDERKEMSESNQAFSEILPQDSNLTEIRIEYHLFFLRVGSEQYKLSKLIFPPAKVKTQSHTTLLKYLASPIICLSGSDPI
jgi:hypothetical protein